MVRESLVGQSIQLTGRRIFFELVVPRSRIKGRKPLPKRGELLGSEVTDVVLELLDLGHEREYKRTLIVRLTDCA
jgi:hypothetical protein